jgi:uncharacterized protein (TIGR00304 family)
LLNAGTLYGLGFALVFVGVFIIILTFLLFFFSGAKKQANAKGGGVIVIGPFPIVFGTDQESTKTFLVLSIVLVVVVLVTMIVSYLISR